MGCGVWSRCFRTDRSPSGARGGVAVDRRLEPAGNHARNATLFGILFIWATDHGEGERMADLAVAALMTIGGGFVRSSRCSAGSLGATLSGRRRGDGVRAPPC